MPGQAAHSDVERAAIDQTGDAKDETGDAPGESDVQKRGLSEALGTTELAVNYYRLPPGTGLPGGIHAHRDQEEVFHVLAGEATFECLSPAGEGETKTASTVAVGRGTAIRFAPGEFQSGRNDGDEVLEILALGAPRNTDDIRVPARCPDCGHGDLRLDSEESGLTFVCPDCGDEHVPSPCPDCGAEDLHITLDESLEPVVVCRECDAVFERPPVRD